MCSRLSLSLLLQLFLRPVSDIVQLAGCRTAYPTHLAILFLNASQLFSSPFIAALQHVAMYIFAHIRVLVPIVLATQRATA